MAEEKNNTFALEMKQDMLKFAQKLDTSDCEFLRDFSQYLKDGYTADHFIEKPGSDWRMVKLRDFIDDVYFLPIRPKSSDTKGCALLGGTPFDKLDFVKSFLEACVDPKYADDAFLKNYYAVADCEGKAKRPETLERYARKYNDVSFVIFNNCENILRQEDNLRLFKSLCERDRKLTFLDTATNKFKDFVAKSWYILLGNENKMHEIFERAKPAFRDSISYRINTFHCFIRIFDFNEEPLNIPDEKFNEFLHEIEVK